jgi:hypothetical protein
MKPTYNELVTALENCESYLNYAFQETGEQKYMEASDVARKILCRVSKDYEDSFYPEEV